MLAERLAFYLRDDVKSDAASWGDAYRWMPPGERYERWDTERTPFLREIAECMASTDPAHRMVLICKPAQTGATQLCLNEILRRIHQAPCRMVVYRTNQDTANKWAEDYLEKAIAQKPFADNAALKFKGAYLNFPGGNLQWHGVGNTSGLRSITARFVVADEISAYQEDVGGEGNVLSLIDARVRTFGTAAKIVGLSTPVSRERGSGSWYSMCMQGDWRTYRVPCPFCGEKWVWDIKDVKKIPLSDDEDNDEYDYVIECPKCHAAIEDGSMRDDCVRKGEWKPTQKGEKGVVSFQFSGLYMVSEWISLEKIYTDYEKAVMGGDLKAFTNNVLGQFYDDPVARTPLYSDAALRMIQPHYEQGTVPHGVCVLTAGIDVQRSAGGWLSWEVRGWGKNFENWSIDRGIWKINIADTHGVAKLVRDLMTKQYPALDEHGKPTGKVLKVRVTGIDSGDGKTSQEVYDLCNLFHQPVIGSAVDISIPRNALLPTKGESSPHKSELVTGFPGALTARGGRMRSFRIGTWHGKRELYLALGMPETSDKIFARPHAPVDYNEDYYAELTAEDYVADRNAKDGTVVYKFINKGNKRNESLDLYVITRFLAEILGCGRWEERDWDRSAEVERVEKGSTVRRVTQEERKKRRESIEKRREERKKELENRRNDK